MGTGKWRHWLSLCLGLAGLYAAAAQAASIDSTAPVKPHLRSAQGALSISDSRGGKAILDAANLAPGDKTTGSVSLVAKGGGRARLTLAASNTSTKGDADLTDVLELRVENLRDGGNVVFDGPLAEMRHVALGPIEGGQRRSYRFTATLSESAGNEYQGASASTDFVWSASALKSKPACARLLRGDNGSQRLRGTRGGDRIVAGAGSDVARGLSGRDCIDGQGGSDRLYGGSGDDRIVGGPGPDVIRCGHGFDVARVDDLDTVSGCEEIRRG